MEETQKQHEELKMEETQKQPLVVINTTPIGEVITKIKIIGDDVAGIEMFGKDNQPIERLIITLIGSSKYKDEFTRIAKELTLKGQIVLLPCIFPETDDDELTDEEKGTLISISLDMIKFSNKVFVINPDNHIDVLTNVQLVYATELDKEIEYLVK